MFEKVESIDDLKNILKGVNLSCNRCYCDGDSSYGITYFDNTDRQNTLNKTVEVIKLTDSESFDTTLAMIEKMRKRDWKMGVSVVKYLDFCYSVMSKDPESFKGKFIKYHKIRGYGSIDVRKYVDKKNYCKMFKSMLNEENVVVAMLSRNDCLLEVAKNFYNEIVDKQKKPKKSWFHRFLIGNISNNIFSFNNH